MPATYVAPSHLLPFYLAWQLNPESAEYHLNFSYQFENDSNVEDLLKQVQRLVTLRPYLRQTFKLEDGVLLATVHEEYALTVCSHSVKYIESLQLEQKLIQDPFLLEDTPPLRLHVVHITDQNIYSVLFSVHHIIMDGITLDAFIYDLNQLLADKNVAPENTDTYIFKMQAEPVLQDVSKDESVQALSIEYASRVNAMMTGLELPSVAIEKNTSKSNVLHYTAVMPESLTQKLKEYSHKNSISFFNIFLVTYALFLAKITDQSCMVVRYPINIRQDKSMLGCFLNVLALPLQFNSTYSYAELLQHMQEMLSQLRVLRRVQLNELLKVNNTPNFSSLTVAHLKPLILHDRVYEAHSYPQLAGGCISIKYREQNQRFYFVCDVLSNLYPEFLSASLLARFFHYCEQLLDKPEVALNKTDLLFAEERQRLLIDWNNTTVPYPYDKTLVDCFMETVDAYPKNIAIKNHQGSMTYCELNECAENIAAELMSRGVYHEELVGILIDHRLEMITAIFGILKAGAAYVPIAHNTPTERIASVIQDSAMRFLLTTVDWEDQVKKKDIQILNISAIQHTKREYCAPAISPRQLAYVIYTSGTTGQPKGIAIEQRGVLSYANFLIRDNHLDYRAVGCKCNGFGFDISVSEIYPILLTGGVLCIVHEKDRSDVDAISRFFCENKVTYACLPTQMGESFFHIQSTTLKNLGVGGEKLNYFISRNYRVFNIYGPTEATVQTTSFVVSELLENIPIGKPIDNLKCYIVDHDLNLLPPGARGELCISGVGLSRGYLNREDLTAIKFIDNPFATVAERKDGFDRLYKTGDLVQWEIDGNIVYRGRQDLQIKLGGCRIELEEIESVLKRHPDITQCAVMLYKKSKQAYLVSYYQSTLVLHEKILLDYLAKFLPSYMLPQIFVRMERFPLNINGKIDRGALPRHILNTLEHYAAPQTRAQSIISRAFMKVLDIPDLGLHANFFTLGGNSMKAISLVSELRNEFEVKVSDIYIHSTPERLAAKIKFLKNSLYKRLLQMKAGNFFSPQEIVYADFDVMRKIYRYRSLVGLKQQVYFQKSMHTVLLTGGTGYLGCNVLHQLLQLTDYSVILLLRAKNINSAWERLSKKYIFYFDMDLSSEYSERITIVIADLEKPYLNMDFSIYEAIAKKVDAVIHTAALVKHYGDYETFYSANVAATRNLLEFCKVSKGKDFHYVSTISVLSPSRQSRCNVFTEEDEPQHLLDRPLAQVYLRTKLEGEALVLAYRKKGITGNIYRVGNLACMFTNGRLQENREDNAFYHQIKTLLRLGIVHEILGSFSISPVDLTAKALVLLFDKKRLENMVLHVFNPDSCNLSEMLIKATDFNLRAVSRADFIDSVVQHLSASETHHEIERFALHQGWLEPWQHFMQRAIILQDRTQEVLRTLNFSWCPVSIDLLKRYLSALRSTNQLSRSDLNVSKKYKKKTSHF